MKIKREVLNIPGSLPKGVSPLPKFRPEKHSTVKCEGDFPEQLSATLGYQERVLPYTMQDRYDRSRDPISLETYVLENEYLRAQFIPSLGGRLHSLYDKVLGRELLFTNSVIQPGNLAIRNAWLSGGIEWNIGNFGHTYTTCDNVYTALMQDGEGNDFLRIYEFERNKSIFWQVDFHLPDGSPVLYSHVRLVNPFDEDTTVYWWTNIAVPSSDKTRVLASGKNVISLAQGRCMYEPLPYLKAMNEVDCSYPINATRSYDYFIQHNYEGESTWEASCEGDGHLFFERSTAPLYYKKLFCWGNHRGGERWQEFLSDGEGTGYYVEIQAGIAPSQLHDKLFPKHTTLEWTQCYGGMQRETEKLYGEYVDAVKYLDLEIDSVISAEDIKAKDLEFSALADLPVKEEALVNCGTGFGALEIMRVGIDGDGEAPKNLLFPKGQIGENESVWLALLEDGKMPEAEPLAPPVTYNVSSKWLPRIKKAYESDPNNWFAAYHYGVAIYENVDNTRLASLCYDENERAYAREEAKQAWLRSAGVKNNPWAYRCLAVLEERLGNIKLAEAYYNLAIMVPGWATDFAIGSEMLAFLIKHKRYFRAFQVYKTLPEICKTQDRVKISAAMAAVKLGNLDYLDAFFAEEHYDIREGECTLTNVWFEYSARRLARERGIDMLTSDKLQELIDEAEETCPPPPSIDFRMSVDKNNKYRVSE